jgi:hypothetical protein
MPAALSLSTTGTLDGRGDAEVRQQSRQCCTGVAVKLAESERVDAVY